MNDRDRLELGEARILYFTWKVTQSKVMTKERKEWIRKIYGPGAVERIDLLMKKLHQESME